MKWMFTPIWEKCSDNGDEKEMNWSEIDELICPPDLEAAARSKQRWDAIAKPLGSLGRLEDAIIKIAALTGNEDVRLDKRAVLVFCADNGVVAEGVTQTSSDITALVAGNIARGDASVCRMGAVSRARVTAVDIGMLTHPAVEGLLNTPVARGTKNIALGPAMTRDEAECAIKIGIDLVRQCREQGFRLIATGEMGIGNTTTSSAVASVLLSRAPAEMTGRGAGLSDEGLMRKTAAVERAIEINKPDAGDALDVLAKVGGFDIAGMAGVFIGGAMLRVPVLLDGFISAVSALVAARICPRCVNAMLASHVSSEPAAAMVLDALGLKPLINADMHLGEGTGAVCAMPMLDMVLAVYDEMRTFTEIGMDSYIPLGEGV